jgi:hypothetical protein
VWISRTNYMLAVTLEHRSVGGSNKWQQKNRQKNLDGHLLHSTYEFIS